VGLEGLVDESEGRQSSPAVEEKLAFAEFRGFSFPSGPFLDTVELDLEVLSESEGFRAAVFQPREALRHDWW
jgi:hypothetical protein